MQKGFAPIFLLIGVFVVAAISGAYYLGTLKNKSQPTPPPNSITSSQTPQATASPAPDETANWKSYIDTDLGITFKYPTTWEVKTQVIAGPNTKQVYLEAPQDKDGSSYAVAFDYIDNPQNLSIKDYQEKLIGRHLTYYSEKSMPVKIAGINGFYEKDGNCEPYPCGIYTIPYKGKFWIIKLMNTEAEKYLNEKEKVVYTFKFTQ